MFKHDCTKHGHRYEARFDKRLPADIPQNRLMLFLADEIKAMQNIVYVRDICVRCGHVIERKV